MLRAGGAAGRLARAGAGAGRRALGSAVRQEVADVPAGHQNSDLSDWACNTGLGRRRDITLRKDVQLYDTAGSHTLKELFRVRGRNAWLCLAWLDTALSSLFAHDTPFGSNNFKALL